MRRVLQLDGRGDRSAAEAAKAGEYTGLHVHKKIEMSQKIYPDDMEIHRGQEEPPGVTAAVELYG